MTLSSNRYEIQNLSLNSESEGLLIRSTRRLYSSRSVMSLSGKRIEVLQRHLMANKVSSQSNMAGNPITSHVLDTATGKPAANLKLSLHKLTDSGWLELAQKVTNNDGRAGQFLTQESFTKGTYKMFFDTADYFSQQNTKGFYPYVEIVFNIENPADHYHIPLLLSPFGYSTYRGS